MFSCFWLFWFSCFGSSVFGSSGFSCFGSSVLVLLVSLVLDHPSFGSSGFFLFRIICFGSSGFLVLDHLSLVLLPFYKYQIYLMFVVMFLDSYCSNLKQIGKQQHLQILIYNYPLQLLQIDHLHHIASRL